jgi:GNAT superfamily N-acetyltransferase
MIRPATPHDLDEILALGRRLHQTSTYCDRSFDDEKVRALMASLIDGHGVVFVGVVSGVIVGGIAGAVTEYWFGRHLHGFDFSFFIAEEHRSGSLAMKLLLALEAWCKARGAVEMRLGITTGINVEGTTRFYEYLGYRSTGPLFTKAIDHGN